MGLKTSIQQEKIIFAYMLRYPNYLLFISKDFFTNEDIQLVALTAKNFFKEYKESPSCEQMISLFKEKENTISIDTIRSIYNIEINSYDDIWLRDTTEGWIKWRALNVNVVKAVSYIKTTDITLDNVVDVVHKATCIVSDTSLINFDTDLGSNFFDVDSHKSVKEYKIHYTWEYFNKISKRGLDLKTLTCYIGGTNSGKSVYLCNDAAEFVRKGKNVLYITCEMSPTKVTRRIAANLFDVTLEEYDTLVEDPNKVKKKLNNLNTMSIMPHGKLFIKEFPTGQGTVLDVERYIKEIENTQKFKVDVVIIDYINIMCNYRLPNSESTYLKIKQIAEDLRGIAVKYNLAIITATQCGRNALDKGDINMEDVAESMGLLHTVDTCFGIIQTDDMRMGSGNENSEGIPVPYYYVKILKIREGEGRDTKFKINANYSKMKLIESSEIINTLSHLS
jgi:archaellum biogenesis ATPase FlaH